MSSANNSNRLTGETVVTMERERERRREGGREREQNNKKRRSYRDLWIQGKSKGYKPNINSY